MRNAFVKELVRLAQTDPKINLITADLGYNVLNHFADQFANRFFNAGISEQNMTSVAAGLALSNKTVYTYSIGNFSTLRCLEQIRNDICYHNANVKIVIVGGGFAYAQLGMSHHATEDIAALRALPNMRVFVPADPIETIKILNYVNSIDGPCYIRLAKGGEKSFHTNDEFDITSPVACVAGYQVAVFACGPILEEALIAAKELLLDGIELAVYSVPCIKPLNKDSVGELLRQYANVITLEEHTVIGGLGGAMAEIMAECPNCATKLVRMGLQDCYTSVVGDQKYLRNYYQMSSTAIVDVVKNLVKRPS